MKFITTDKPFSVFSLEADRDYILARLINFSGMGFAPRAGYFGQQAIEKYLKALMVSQDKHYLKEHDLTVLAKYCSKYDSKFKHHDFLKRIKIFDDFREVGRYGGESSYDPQSKKEMNFTTAGAYVWMGQNIKILDELVSYIRTKLNFDEIGFSDSLTEISKDSRRDFLANEWKLPIKLKDILTTDNSFFN
ncbi:MAG: HEPN domain-containing protein [bacterium]|nr:HEPN domain-containing protein [bacterium]